MEPHGENPRGELVPDLGYGHWWRGEVDLRVVLPPLTEFSYLYIGGLPREESHIGKDMGALHLQKLEGKGDDPAGGAAPLSTVTKLRHANTSAIADPSPTYRQMQLFNIDANVAARRGDGSEGGRYGV